MTIAAPDAGVEVFARLKAAAEAHGDPSWFARIADFTLYSDAAGLELITRRLRRAARTKGLCREQI
jgi:hypothetical protein